MTRGRVLRLPFITRAMVQADRNSIFVFGDNMQRSGYGGQAKEMRNEPNSIGVPTKWAPQRHSWAYFNDDDFLKREVQFRIADAFERMRCALNEGKNVVIPADGVGTGLADLSRRAPKLFTLIEANIADLSK